MTLDAIDRAFIARWHDRVTAAPPAPGRDQPSPGWREPAAASEAGDRQPAAAEEDRAEHPATPLTAGAEGLVERLLQAGRDQWLSLAAEVESARLAGHRVIAVAGGEQGEGRSTLVACLAHVLRDRGREVVVHASTADLTSGDAGPADGGRLHDKRIILVDAGIWFPPGPIRRHRLLVASLGCDAAILVRRADRPSAPARETALAAVGVTPLGEVVTFASVADATPRPAGAR